MPSALHLFDLIQHISTPCIFHDNTQARGSFVVKCIFIRNDIWVIDRSQDPNFIERVLLFFAGELSKFHLFKCIDVPVFNAAYFIDIRV